MIIQGQVGTPATSASLSSGTQPNIRLGNMGDLIVSELQGRYYEGTYRRNRFAVANQAGATTTVGLATTYTGLAVANPVGSTVNLVLDKVGAAFTVAPAAALAFGLAVGFNSGTNVTLTTPATVRNEYFTSGGAGQGVAATAATLPTAPVLQRVFGSVAAAILASPVSIDLEGSIILPPGAYAILYTSAASGAAGFFGSVSWEEVPL